MKALILSIDAMFSDQVERLKQRSALSPFFHNCLTARDMQAIYPALTYPCHVSILPRSMVCTIIWTAPPVPNIRTGSGITGMSGAGRCSMISGRRDGQPPRFSGR